MNIQLLRPKGREHSTLPARWAVWIISAALMLPSSLSAQGARGTLSGMVKDTSGAAMPNVAVTAVNLEANTAFRATTSGAGNFTLTYLPLGSYKVTFEAQGFKSAVREGITLHVNDVLTLDVTMAVGQVSESIVVSDEVPLLTPESSSMGTVVNNRVVTELPLNGRNPFVLQQIVAGVIPTGGSGNVNLNRPWDTNSVSDISVNGAPGRSNMLTINGVYSKGGNQVAFTPAIDAVQEFKVQKNSYDAEFGHAAGGTINVATKAGTNELHGTFYEFMRNSALDANTFFGNKAGAKKPLFRMNQFGLSAGGPVRLPKMYDGLNRTFWFFNWEGVRQSTPPTTVMTSVPTELQRSGDFSKTFAPGGDQVTIFDPMTGRPDALRPGQYIRTPFAGNLIPAARMSAVARNVLGYIPGPNRTGDPGTGLNNYVMRGGGSQDYDQYGGRLDHAFSEKSRIFGSVGYSNYTEVFLSPYGNIATDGRRLQQTRNAALDYVRVMSPSTLLNLRYGFSRKYENTVVGSAGFDPGQLGFPRSLVSQFPFTNFPRFSIGDAGGTLGHGGPSYNASDGHNLTGIVNRTMGKHSVKAGFFYLLLREYDDRGGSSGSSGSYSFGRNWTQEDPFRNSANSGFGTASLLLGVPSSGQVGQGGYQASQTTFYEFFVQDDVRITSRLTLNLGLRWEYQGATTERFNRLMANFDFNAGLPIAESAQAAYAANPIAQLPASQFRVAGGPVWANTGGQGRSQLRPEYNNFAPRIGFAYQLSQRVVWRGGYGIFYNPRLTGVNMRGFDVTTPMLVSIDGIVPIRDLSNPFPDGLLQAPAASRSVAALLGQDGNFTNPEITTPRVSNWSTGFQYQLSPKLLVEGSYVGTIANRGNPGWAFNNYDASYLSLGSELNRAVPNPFFGIIPVSAGALGQRNIQLGQLLRPFPAYLNVNGSIPGTGRTTYHSAQASVEKRFDAGFSFLASYTFSKLMDRSSFMNSGYSNVYESVISDIDRPQRLVFTGLWELPFGKGKSLAGNASGALNVIIGGWQISNVASFQSGRALQAPGNAIATGVSPVVDNPTVDRWFNTAAFAVQPPFTLRVLSRNISSVRASGIANWDLSMIKNNQITERIRLQFRAEFFNAMNRVQFDQPDRNVTSGNFGKVTSQSNIPRQIQFGLRIIY